MYAIALGVEEQPLPSVISRAKSAEEGTTTIIALDLTAAEHLLGTVCRDFVVVSSTFLKLANKPACMPLQIRTHKHYVTQSD